MLLTAEELARSSKLDLELYEVWKTMSPPLNNWGDWRAIREETTLMGQKMAVQIGPPNPEIVKEEYLKIPLRDGYQSALKILKPVHPQAGGSPLIIFAYGGGFISGDLEQGTLLGRMFVKAFNAVVVNISYRLAPENRFPTAQLDGWDTVKWAAENASGLGANPTKGFIVAGVSAGGCISSVVATKAIEEPLAFPLTGQYLIAPAIMERNIVPEKYRPYHISMEQVKVAPILPAKAVDLIDGYTQADKNSPLRYPILSKAPLSKQPKAYIQASGMDPLRDDALIWDEMLKDAGVQTKCHFYSGCPHTHWAFFPGTSPANKAVADLVIGMGWLLGEDLSAQEAMGRAM